MKRILRIWLSICLSGLSLFFTGCKGETVSTFVEVMVTEDKEAPERPTEAPKDPARLPDVEKAAGAQTALYMEERFEGLTAPRAFYFPEHHSADYKDMKAFQILGLLEDTFYYFYVTRDSGSGQEVHAAARYNYKTQEYKLLYENRMENDSTVPGLYDDFYCHLCADSQGQLRLSVYEDGNLSLLTGDGDVIFSRTSESGGEDFLYLIDSIFGVGGENPVYYDRDITNVTTDGRYSFQIPITLYKNDYTKLENTDTLEDETFVLRYTFSPIGVGEWGKEEYLLQEDLAWDDRVDYWKRLGGKGNAERDPELDWKKACELYPEQWGPYYIAYGLNWAPTYISDLWQWKDKSIRDFVEGKAGISTESDEKNKSYESLLSIPQEDAILTDVTEIEAGQDLLGYFFVDGNRGYSALVGRVGDKSELYQEITREYTVIKEDGKGGTTEEIHKETISKLSRKKARFAQGAAIEEFYVSTNAMGLGVVAGPVKADGSYIMAMTINNVAQLVDFQESLDIKEIATFPRSDENVDISVLEGFGNDSYMMANYMDTGMLSIWMRDNKFINIRTSDLNPSGYTASETDRELVDQIQERSREGGNPYVARQDFYANPDRHGKESVFVAKRGEDKGILFTTFYNGMLYFDTDKYTRGDLNPVEGRVYQLTDQPLYRAWQTGDDEITAVGFDRTDTTYYYMDIGMARVYTFSLEESLEKASSYEVPLQRENPPQTGGQGGQGDRKPPQLEGVELPEIPDIMQKLQEDSKKSPPIQYSTESPETLPDVTIEETGSAMKGLWEDSAERKAEDSLGD